MILIRSHDALVRFVFGEPAEMAELLRAHLPAAVVAAIDSTTLVRTEGTFVDKTLRQRHTDLLFEARMGAATVLLYLLHEHKAEEERLVSLQMAGYAVRILEHWRTQHPEAKTLPAVLPFVLYHGERPWQAPRSLGELIDLRGCGDDVVAFLRALQLEQRVFVVDLAVLDEPRIDATRLSAVTGLTLRFLQFLRPLAPADAVAAIVRWQDLIVRLLAHARGEQVLFALFSWWLSASPDSSEALRTVMTRITEENAPMRSLLDRLLEMGEERGVQQGMQQGLLAGRRSLLREQLAGRFGELPAVVAQRLDAADAGALQRWGLRVLTAPTLDAVFDPA